MLTFERASAYEEPAASLLRAADAALAEIYGPARGPTTAAELSPPTGGFVLGSRDGDAVACGGFRFWADGTAEVRRMFVVPEARSQGVARQLLAAVEDAARAAGYARVILDTGAKQPHAIALYRSAGYRDIPRYEGSGSTAVYWGEKLLA